MTDSPRRDVPDPTQPLPYGYPGDADPAYSNQTPYGSYQPPASTNPTQQLPPYQPYGYDPYTGNQYSPPNPPGAPPEPPDPNGRGPRVWLWALAAVSLVVVVGLVIALVIVNSSQQDTVVAPPPAPLEPNFTTPSTTRTPTTTRSPAPVPPAPTTPPGETTTPGETETVVYDVSGQGRAINITYVDAGGLLQTEFNVMLPWSKEVQLTKPADRSASVSVINVGREISCSITLNGTEIQHRNGSGLTVCSALG